MIELPDILSITPLSCRLPISFPIFEGERRLYTAVGITLTDAARPIRHIGILIADTVAAFTLAAASPPGTRRHNDNRESASSRMAIVREIESFRTVPSPDYPICVYRFVVWTVTRIRSREERP